MADLEDAIKTGTQDRRIETLRRVTDLFLGDADRLNEAQVGVFDDVLCHLIKRIETRAIAELSARLAPVDNSPVEVIRTLARSDEIAVAGPVLAQSSRLTARDLVEIARTKSQAHLLAISERAQLEEAVTDELLVRGDSNVAHVLAGNAGARFSETGLESLIKRAKADDTLTMRVGLRLDVPPRLLRELLSKATETVRQWLLSNAGPEAGSAIQWVLTDVSNEVGREATAPRDFTRAQEVALKLQKRGELNETTILEFANTQRYEELVAAISVSCSTSVQLVAALMKSRHNGGLLVPCKAAGLKWPTVAAVLKNRFAHYSISDQELAQAKSDYLVLSQASAQRTLRFWQVRSAVAR
jgi:uncharacterized protein (DUF2336 family)